MKSYFDCWVDVATTLFSQALAGEPQLAESLPKPLAPGAFSFAATIEGDEAGRFAVLLDPTLLDSPLMGDGADQKAGWAELLKETVEAAAGELFQLKSGDRSWAIMIRDEVKVPKPAAQVQAQAQAAAVPPQPPPPPPAPSLSPGLQLLLDVELEASLRFGCKELPLAEILELGPGDVVQLDRHVSDPVDLIVGDKIVARGEVILVNGNFGLRVTEQAGYDRGAAGI
jgi:flagellar motor switch protein FliN/FliY